MHSNGFGGKGATPPEETDTKVRKFPKVSGRVVVLSLQGREVSLMEGGKWRKMSIIHVY